MLLELLIELELLILAMVSFFVIGKTTPSPLRPKRENLGTGSDMDTQFTLGSREVEGGRG